MNCLQLCPWCRICGVCPRRQSRCSASGWPIREEERPDVLGLRIVTSDQEVARTRHTIWDVLVCPPDLGGGMHCDICKRPVHILQGEFADVELVGARKLLQAAKINTEMVARSVRHCEADICLRRCIQNQKRTPVELNFRVGSLWGGKGLRGGVGRAAARQRDVPVAHKAVLTSRWNASWQPEALAEQDAELRAAVVADGDCHSGPRGTLSPVNGATRRT
mmetsp:Transcript_101811/g.183685  ORF Transcript_101811/g.183685 Transcript_101811/m.183685 type:complete len:220 (+) Transcript_101811:350-1009(+)